MFANRTDAGRKLAQQIPRNSDSLVLAIPRGGVVVGDVISKMIGCSLDIAISKKITPPGFPEYAIGAVACDGTIYKGKYWAKFSDNPQLADEISSKRNEVRNRLERYRGHMNYDIENKRVILVDDGIATGSTVLAILKWIEKQHPKKIILAVPVMPFDTLEKMKTMVDDVITLETPKNFSSVSQFYDDFSQVSESQVMQILRKYHL